MDDSEELDPDDNDELELLDSEELDPDDNELDDPLDSELILL